MRRAAAGLVLPALIAGACRPTTQDHARPAAIDEPPARPATTSADVALGNLDAEIAEGLARPGGPTGPRLVDDLLVRARFLDRVADLEAADAASRRELTTSPDAPEVRLRRARVLGALHELDAAAAEIDQAAALGATARSVTAARLPVLLARGRCDEAMKLAPPEKDATSFELAWRGSLEGRRGREAESDRLFTAARTNLRDVSPFAVAWLDFERARDLEHSGHGERARGFLREALAALPVYAHAAVHLAAMESPDRALAILRAVESTSDGVDVHIAKADALRRKGSPDAERANAEARARLEVVLERFPRAFADHGAGYFLGPGKDASRGLALARLAATNAPTEDAIGHWLSAAQALASRSEACAAVAVARSGGCALGPTLAARVESAAKGCP